MTDRRSTFLAATRMQECDNPECTCHRDIASAGGIVAGAVCPCPACNGGHYLGRLGAHAPWVRTDFDPDNIESEFLRPPRYDGPAAVVFGANDPALEADQLRRRLHEVRCELHRTRYALAIALTAEDNAGAVIRAADRYLQWHGIERPHAAEFPPDELTDDEDLARGAVLEAYNGATTELIECEWRRGWRPRLWWRRRRGR
jgi:hypothetical protein